MKVKIPLNGNKVLGQVLDLVNDDIELNTIWRCGNRNAVDRMKINDHGIVHITIVSNIALRLHRLLQDENATFNVVADDHYTIQDSEVVVFLAVCMHDIGHAIHRRRPDHRNTLRTWWVHRRCRTGTA